MFVEQWTISVLEKSMDDSACASCATEELVDLTQILNIVMSFPISQLMNSSLHQYQDSLKLTLCRIILVNWYS